MNFAFPSHRRRLLIALLCLGPPAGLLFAMTGGRITKPATPLRVETKPEKTLAKPQAAITGAVLVTEPAQSGGAYNIQRSVIAGGGETSSGGDFSQTSTIGQSAVGQASGGAFSVSGGFWQGSVCNAPSISHQPSGQAVCAGSSVMFSVTATGTGLSYQWRKNSVNISGATASSYSIASAVAGDAGNYDVIITGGCGAQTSTAVTLTVNPTTTIATHPASQNTTVGQSITFSVTAAGIGLSYQWRKGGTNISGATASVYAINTVIPADAGNYDVVVTGTCGNATSNPATLTVGCQTISVTPANSILPAGTLGTLYSQNFSQSGGLGIINWSHPGGGLPGNLSLTPTTGELSGMPTATGTFTFIIRATDANACFGERSYTLQINNAPCPAIVVSPANPALVAGIVGSVYNQTFTQAGGAGAIAWSVSSGNLPAGLTLGVSTGVLSGTPTAMGASAFTIRATDANQCLGERQYTLTINPAGTAGNGLQFYPLATPVRLLDTRAGLSGCVTGTGAFAGGSTRTLAARTVCSTIPANALAVIGNITVVPTAPGFLTLFPGDGAQPTVANSNFGVGEITNNVFTVGLGASGPDTGAFKIFSSAATHVIVDVTGYYAPPGTGGLYFHPLPAPVRLLETRAGFNGCFAQGTPLIGTGNPNADPNQDLPVPGRSPIPSPCNSIPASAQVLVGNATSVLPGGGGYLTIYPSGGTRPTVASSNYAGNDVINGPFAVKLGADGKFKIYTLLTTHLVVDILGYYSEEAVDANGAGLLFNPLPEPVRLLETRPGGPPLTGCTRTNTPIAGNVNAATHTQQARNFCGLPVSAQAVVGNVSVVNTAGAGFLTLFPGNLTNAPLVATSNYTAPATFGYNRHYFVGLSPADGTFKVLTQFTTDLILDASGYFAP